MIDLDRKIAEGRRQLAELQIAATYGDKIAELVLERFAIAERQVLKEWERAWMEGSCHRKDGIAGLIDPDRTAWKQQL